jgi:pyridoxine kinase
MGDVGRGFFVQDGLPAYFRDRAVPKADIVTPNQFELEYLTGRQIVSVEDAMDAVAALRRMGPDLVLLTSLRCEGMKRKTVHMLAADGDGAWLISTPELPISVNGAGDAVAALFLGYCLRAQAEGKRNLRSILSRVASSIYTVLEATLHSGAREIQIIAAQDALAHPQQRFEPAYLGKLDA